MFLTSGDFPYYRDITAGAKGADVTQWQTYLRSTGFTIPRSENGTAGPRTVRATSKFYRNRDYLPPSEVEQIPGEAEGGDGEGTSGESSAGGGADASTSPQPSSAPSTSSPTTSGEVAAGTVILPASETLVMTEAGQRVVGTPAVGDRIGDEGASISLSEGGVTATTAIPAIQASGVTEGMKVIVTPDGGDPRSGTLGKIPAVGTAGEDGSVPDLQIPVNLDGGVPEDWDGKDFLIEIVQQEVSPDALVVPSRAVAGDGSGSSVYVRQSDGSFQQVHVTEIGFANGETAIDPTDGDVAAGDLVRLG